jgi:hypothetical protein
MAPPKGTTKTPAAAAAALKKAVAAASKKTTGESEADYPPSAPVRVVSKTYGLSTYDKYAVSEYAEGSSDFYEIEFYVNGVLPEVGGYLATLSEDGYTLKWSRPIEELLFTMGHLKSIMGEDYSPSHVRVRAFDDVTQAMFKDKVEPDASGVYWGDPQKVHLKEKCTGTVKALAKVYRAPTKVEAIKYKGRRSYQFNTIVSCKVQWAERRKTASVKTKTTVVDMFDVPSSQGTTPSPGIQRGRKRDWGGSHQAEPHRGSRVSQGDDISDASDES